MIEGTTIKAIRMRSHEEGPICEIVLSMPVSGNNLADLSMAMKANLPVALQIQQMSLIEPEAEEE